MHSWAWRVGAPSTGSPHGGMRTSCCTAWARGYGQSGRDRGHIQAPSGAGELWCTWCSTSAPHEPPHPNTTASSPSPRARSCPSLRVPWAGTTGHGHGQSLRTPSRPHQPCQRCPWKNPRILGEAGLHPQAQDRGSLVGSGAGAAGGPEELSCGDVAGMCVGVRQGGGEGGRGSGRGSSSFDKQLPEHFQTVALDRHAVSAGLCQDRRSPRRGAAGTQPPSLTVLPAGEGTLLGNARPGTTGYGHVLTVGSSRQGWDDGQGDGADICGSSQGPPACQGLGWSISQVCPGWCAGDGCGAGACCCLWTGSPLVLQILGSRRSCPAWHGDSTAAQPLGHSA